MLLSFRCKETQKIYNGIVSRRLPQNMQRVALRKLLMIESTHVLDDLREPPGNRLESLSGNRKGQHSIRINNQWRICFTWKNGNAHDIEIVDYH